MSSATQPLAMARRGPVAGLLQDYAELLKPRITSLVMMSAWCGFYMAAARGGVSSLSWQLLHTLAGIGMVCGGVAALNQVMEHEADARMLRTNRRPLPAKRMGVVHAALFGTAVTLGGAAYLALETNLLTGMLALATAFAYLVLYTPLKKVSTICTFVGAFPGAMPPVLGWTAMRGHLEWEAVALFAIGFLWQFPHFFSIAWLYREDYEAASIRMLPVVEIDGRSTVRQVLGFSAVLVPVSMAPAWLGMAGVIYMLGAALLSLGFLGFGVRLARLQAPANAPRSKPYARHLLQASIIYLPLLFALMMLDAR
jgi:protoheme IX farnesyltransferase